MLELPTLPIIRIHILLQLEGNTPISHFPEATIRGGLGYYLRGQTCLMPSRECAECPLQRSCLYANLFDPENDFANASKQKYPLPKPWAIFAKGCPNGIDLEVSFFGNYAMMLKPFLEALNQLGKNGIGAYQTRFIVKGFAEPQRILLNEISYSSSTEQYLKLFTPMSIRANGKRLLAWDTKAFASTLLRRIYALSALQGLAIPANWNYQKLLSEFDSVIAEFETKVAQRTRFSTHQNAKLEYQGFEGTVHLKNVNETASQLLAIGSYIGVGKNTVFGFGKYEVIA